MRWKHCDKKTLASGERSRLIPLKRERPRKHLKLQGRRLSSLVKRKASTILPHTPSPPPNKLPSSQPIPLTSPPPSQGTPWLPLPPPPSQPLIFPTTCPPPYILLISHPTTLTTSLQPTSLLRTSPPPFPLLSTNPYALTHSHPTNPNVVTLSPTSRQHPPSHPVGTFHTGALHW